jgi:hypothetical protein
MYSLSCGGGGGGEWTGLIGDYGFVLLVLDAPVLLYW